MFINNLPTRNQLNRLYNTYNKILNFITLAEITPKEILDDFINQAIVINPKLDETLLSINKLNEIVFNPTSNIKKNTIFTVCNKKVNICLFDYILSSKYSERIFLIIVATILFDLRLGERNGIFVFMTIEEIYDGSYNSRALFDTIIKYIIDEFYAKIKQLETIF